MVQTYPPKERRAILQELRIKPVKGKVNGREAARILTWRAKKEEDIEHTYDAGSLRRHVQEGNIEADISNSRMNLYPVDQVFELSIAPRRGRVRKGKKQPGSQNA